MAEQQLAFLKFLPQASKQQLRCILEHITSAQMNAVGEVCYNLLYGTIKIGELKRHRHIIRLLGDKKIPAIKRRAIISQHPNIVVKLIQAVLP